MLRSQLIMNQYSFSKETKALVDSKLTEKGRMKALSTPLAFSEAFPDNEAVFQRIFQERRINSNDFCICGNKISRNYRRIIPWKFKCRMCRRVVSPRKNTPFEGAHKPLNEMLMIIFEMYQSKHGVSAQEISRDYHYKRDTALNKVHKVMEALGFVIHNSTYKPDSIFEADTVHPPIPSGLPKGVRKKRGPGSESRAKVHVVSERGGLTIPYVVEYTDKQSLAPHFSKLPVSATVFTDEAPVYSFLDKNFNHATVNHRNKEYARMSDDGISIHVNVNEAFNGKVKNEIRTIHRGVSSQHLQKYVDAMAFVFSYRFKDIYEAIDAFFKLCCPPISENFTSNKNLD